MLRDYLERPIHVGDYVVYADPHGRNAGASLKDGFVEALTPKMVRIKGGKLKDPDKIVVISIEL